MDILVLFGSTSDQGLYEPLVEELKKSHQVKFEVISAHRNPARLAERLAEADFDIVVGGAGLAAHLPGVIASKTSKAVFGIPVEAAFDGLDAFFSIVQMPFGVPVITCAPAHYSALAPFLEKVESTNLDSVALVVSEEISPYAQKEIERFKKYAQELNFPIQVVDSCQESQANIVLVASEKDFSPIGLSIYVPFFKDEEKSSPEKALAWFHLAKKNGGLWVGMNNSRNALLAFKKLAERETLPLLYEGSVKDIRGYKGKSPYLFEYSDRYSIFDWGHMPDLLDGKGKSLAFLGNLFFQFLGKAETWKNWNSPLVAQTLSDSAMLKELKEQGCFHHCLGLVDKANEPLAENEVSNLLSVQAVNVLPPVAIKEGQTLRWNYDIYQNQPENCLVPLEVIFRFGVPKGSSLISRANDKEYCQEIGLKETPKEGALYEFPIIEFSTKLETRDRYITYSEAKEIAGLKGDEFQRLHDLTALVALRLKAFFQEAGIDLLDGKFEYAFTKKTEKKSRCFMLVDSIGPDELRLTYQGEQLSKENLRRFYKDSAWAKAVEESKQKAQERGEKDWKKICLEELKETPAPLDPAVKEKIEMMYQSLANTLGKQFFSKEFFPKAWTLDKLIKR